jgi:hypothetical protein
VDYPASAAPAQVSETPLLAAILAAVVAWRSFL